MQKPERPFKMKTFVLAVALIGCGKEVRVGPAISPSGTGQLSLFLGSVNAADADFTVLPGSTVANTSFTPIAPDLGANAGTAVTGFFTVDAGSGTVRATTHQGCAAAAQAQSDLAAAFDGAAARPGALAVSDFPVGQTLAPGVYEFTYSVEISSEDFTLHIPAEADAALFLQVGSMLTDSPSSRVISSGDSRSSNPFCRAGSSATLGPSSVLQGSLLPSPLHLMFLCPSLLIDQQEEKRRLEHG